jgi:hypothetical protein
MFTGFINTSYSPINSPAILAKRPLMTGALIVNCLKNASAPDYSSLRTIMVQGEFTKNIKAIYINTFAIGTIFAYAQTNKINFLKNKEITTLETFNVKRSFRFN